MAATSLVDEWNAHAPGAEPARTSGAWRRDLGRRDLRPELLDAPDVSLAEQMRALAGLERINRLSRSGVVLWKAARSLAGGRPGRPLEVLEIASGGGDVAVDFMRRAARGSVAVRYTGVDISPTAVEFARRRAAKLALPNESRLEFQTHDIFSWSPPQRYDVVCCSLFLHHLDGAAAVELLRRMRDAAQQLVVVNDLLRSKPAYWATKLVCPLISRSMIVHRDGPQSVAAAFRKSEVLRLAAEAGLEGAQIRGIWPFRFLLTWRRRDA